MWIRRLAGAVYSSAMTDRLSLTNALADANIDRQKAERIDRVVVRLGSLLVILTGIVPAAIGYLPHA
jgi:hypothetical protein